jgi:hypothetical protein
MTTTLPQSGLIWVLAFSLSGLYDHNVAAKRIDIGFGDFSVGFGVFIVRFVKPQRCRKAD